LAGFVTSKNVNFKATLFSDFATRFQNHGIKLVQPLLNLLLENQQDLSWFTINSSLSLLVTIMKSTKLSKSDFNGDVEKIYKQVLKRALDGCPTDRLKPILKDLTQLIRIEGLTIDVGKQVEALLEVESFSNVKSLKSMVFNFTKAATSSSSKK
jgi:hypothetical protein